MEPIHQEIIERDIEALSTEVNLDDLYPLLREENIIQDDDIRIFETQFLDPMQSLHEARGRNFFRFYKTMGSGAFDALIKSLRTLKLESLATSLESGSENLGGSPVGPSESKTTGSRHVASQCHDIDVKKATLYNMGVTENVYLMQSKPRGYALIVNNISFPNKRLPYRRGAKADSTNLKSLFQNLGFEVLHRQNLAKQQFFKTLDIFKQKFSEKNVDACIVAIMSHGLENSIEMCDVKSSAVRIWEDVMESFNNLNCPELMGKPKIFIIPICRGKDHDKGVSSTETDCGSISGNVQENASNNNRAVLQSSPNINRGATHGDSLLCQSTVPGYVSKRNKKEGTWYVQTLCEVFMENAHNTEIKTLLDMIGREVAKKTTKTGEHQTASYASYGFNYAFYFNPGLYEDNSRLPAPRERMKQQAASSSSSSQLPESVRMAKK